jgi:hypothetical protein
VTQGGFGLITKVPRVDPQVPACDGALGMEFFNAGWTADVALAAGQVINASATIDLGGASGAAASNLTLDLCYQIVHTDQTVGVLVAQGLFIGDPEGGAPLQVPANSRAPISLVRTLTPLPSALGPTDKYRVGVCGCVDGTDSWAPGFGWLSVQVVQPVL